MEEVAKEKVIMVNVHDNANNAHKLSHRILNSQQKKNMTVVTMMDMLNSEDMETITNHMDLIILQDMNQLGTNRMNLIILEDTETITKHMDLIILEDMNQLVTNHMDMDRKKVRNNKNNKKRKNSLK